MAGVEFAFRNLDGWGVLPFDELAFDKRLVSRTPAVTEDGGVPERDDNGLGGHGSGGGSGSGFFLGGLGPLLNGLGFFDRSGGGLAGLDAVAGGGGLL